MAKNTKAINQLIKDKKLKQIILKVGSLPLHQTEDLYISLLKAIVSQQLSVKAADTIWRRFLGLFDDEYPEATEVLKMKDKTLRSVGLSFQKTGYIKNIARFSLDETLDYKLMRKKTDNEIINYLIQIKGVGKWTVEMILMFSLNRPDVFPLDDLGIQNAMKTLYGLKGEKKHLYEQMLMVAENWRPHRTLACRYLWRYKDQGKV